MNQSFYRRGHSNRNMCILMLVIGLVAGFVLRPVYEKHYGEPSSEKLGAQVGRGIDNALDKTGDALEKAGDKLEKKLDEVNK